MSLGEAGGYGVRSVADRLVGAITDGRWERARGHDRVPAGPLRGEQRVVGGQDELVHRVRRPPGRQPPRTTPVRR